MNNTAIQPCTVIVHGFLPANKASWDIRKLKQANIAGKFIELNGEFSIATFAYLRVARRTICIKTGHFSLIPWNWSTIDEENINLVVTCKIYLAPLSGC